MYVYVYIRIYMYVCTQDASTSHRRRKLDAVKHYVRYKRVPLFLRERIIEYYEYMYTRVQSVDEQKVCATACTRVHSDAQ